MTDLRCFNLTYIIYMEFFFQSICFDILTYSVFCFVHFPELKNLVQRLRDCLVPYAIMWLNFSEHFIPGIAVSTSLEVSDIHPWKVNSARFPGRPNRGWPPGTGFSWSSWPSYPSSSWYSSSFWKYPLICLPFALDSAKVSKKWVQSPKMEKTITPKRNCFSLTTTWQLWNIGMREEMIGDGVEVYGGAGHDV